MASTDYDIIIDGTKAKLARDQENHYDLRYVRQEIQQQLISQSEEQVLSSRGDLRQLYQSSWAGGAQWWKPILGPSNVNSYFRSNHMDLWSEPGKVVPSNQVVDAANTSLHDNCVIASNGSGDVYAIGSTANVNASFLDVYKWTPASNAFVQETGYHSGVPVAQNPTHMIFDSTDGYFYLHYTSGSAGSLARFNPSTSAQDTAYVGSTSGSSPKLLPHRQGIIEQLQTNNTARLLDKSGPSFSVIFSDGHGQDYLGSADLSGTPIARKYDLAINTPEGVYFARNVPSTNNPVAWIYRLDRDPAGNWIGSPIATLPVGTVVLSLSYHLGSIIVAASPDYRSAKSNDTQHFEIILYAISSESGISTIGSILGGRDELDETPYALLGSLGPYLYIGGHKRLWVYDSVRGGIHPAFEWPTQLSNGAYVAMALVEDSSGDSAMIFLGRDRIARIKVDHTDDPDTVTNFGDDETHYTLESNYFDGNLPFELKELAGVEILHDAIDGSSNQEWTVQISADDGSFSDVLTNSAADSTYASATLSGTTGRRFRYKLIYQTKDTERIALRALLVKMATGENLREWSLLLDGSELLNVDNEVQDEQAFYDNMKTLAVKEAIVNLVDNMQEQEQLTDSATTVNVKVQSVRILKSKPGESLVQLVVREA